MNSFDPYAILGVKRNATGPELRSAKRRKQSEHHPDRGGDHEKMADINRAYDVLIDPESRAQFDRTGEMPEKVKTLEEIALDGIRMNLVRLLQDDNVNLDGCDLIGSLKTAAGDKLSKIRKEIPRLEKRLKKMEKARTRMKAESLLGVFDQLISALKEAIDVLNKEIPVFEKTIELLSAMKYEFDPNQEATLWKPPTGIEQLIKELPPELFQRFGDPRDR